MGWDARAGDPFIFISEKDKKNIDRLLLSMGVGPESLIMGLSPGAKYGPAKRWPSERFAAIGDRAVEQWHAVVILMGSRDEMAICKEVSQAMSYEPINLCGRTTLGEAVGLLRRCRFFVTNDSGLMHVGAALGVPMVAVFGSTNPETTGPRSNKARIVRYPVDCSPCLKPECPTDFRCMRSIEPEAVWEALADLRAEQE